MRETHRWNERERNDEEVDKITLEAREGRGGGGRGSRWWMRGVTPGELKPPRGARSSEEEHNVSMEEKEEAELGSRKWRTRRGR